MATLVVTALQGCGCKGNSKIEAYSMAKQFATEQLKAPSTADFAGYNDSTVVDAGNNRFMVRSYVDSQNSFGAKLRTHYTCQVEDEQDGNWKLIDIHFEE